jgi:hypothetical protein
MSWGTAGARSPGSILVHSPLAQAFASGVSTLSFICISIAQMAAVRPSSFMSTTATGSALIWMTPPFAASAGRRSSPMLRG